MMVSETEMLQDIREMIVLIAAFTEPNTDGADLLDSWKKKYAEKQKAAVSLQFIKHCGKEICIKLKLWEYIFIGVSVGIFVILAYLIGVGVGLRLCNV